MVILGGEIVVWLAELLEKNYGTYKAKIYKYFNNLSLSITRIQD
jgi:hypothetical protein